MELENDMSDVHEKLYQEELSVLRLKDMTLQTQKFHLVSWLI